MGHTLPPGDHVLIDSADGEVCGYCPASIREIFGSPPRVPTGWGEAFATPDRVLQVYEVP